jgi:dTDP-4-dehydrorhamnose 3,5-epimerase
MNERFRVHMTPLAELRLLERRQMSDLRGFLERLFCAEELRGVGFTEPIAQVTRTVTSRAGALRGLHFQRPPHSEIKLVSCLRGEIFDVAVDLRPESPTFLRWHGEILSDQNHRSLLIPKGFAHGFQTLCPDCELLYCLSAAHAPAAEDGIHARDERLAIAWPRDILELSERDAGLPRIGASFRGLSL